MEEELDEVRAIRDCISQVVRRRETHTDVVSLKDAAVREVNELTGELGRVQARLTAREREIALSGAELPDEPFPEEAEIARLNRHIRIKQERVRGAENKVRESQGELDAQIQKLEESWGALGTAISGRLLTEFREGASALRDAQLGYLSLRRHFSNRWNSAVWRHVDVKLTIGDPMVGGELILNPLHAEMANKWPSTAQMLVKNVGTLRAEIEAVKSNQASTPQVSAPADLEDGE